MCAIMGAHRNTTTTKGEIMTRKTAVIIRTNHVIEVIDIEKDGLDKLQAAVGGYVEAIDLSESVTMWLNEEGKLTGLPHNLLGQMHWDKAFGPDTDTVMGDVVFTGGVDGEGDTVGLTERQLSDLTAIAVL
jgi:hypothetical protein